MVFKTSCGGERHYCFLIDVPYVSNKYIYDSMGVIDQVFSNLFFSVFRNQRKHAKLLGEKEE
ncbi:MAG TPA: hypothetical protein DD811_01335 [Syntrophomonas sp.]|nr:hypothetical protein [Syntrophomonas sp.]